MWAKPQRYDPDRGTLGAFLLAQAHSHSVDRLRTYETCRTRDRRRGAVRQRADIGIKPTARAGDNTWQILSALPDDQRDAIVLAYSQGYTYRDVAHLLGEPEGIITSRIRAGMTRLGVDLWNEGSHSAGSLT